MIIHLGEQWELFIHEQMKRGHYASASEVVRDALRLLQEQDESHDARLEVLRAEVDKGVHALDTDDYLELDADGMRNYLKDVDARGHERLARNKPA